MSSAARRALRQKRLLFFKLGVLLAEAVDAAGSVKEALLASEEGMAGRADFDMHLFALGGKDLLAVAAGTSDCGLVDFGLDIFFHHNLYKCYLKCRTYRHLELSAHTHGLAAASVLVQSSKAAYCALGSTADMRQGAVKESSNRSKQQKWQALEKPLFRHNCAFHTLEAHNFPLLS